jgi:hypothetical protein
MIPRSLLLSLVGLLLAFPFAFAEPLRQPDPSQQAAPAFDKKPISVTGKVTEILNAGGYTYVSLSTSAGAAWAAFPSMSVTIGQKLTLVPGYEMRNFSSKSLNRKFDRIIFSSGPADKQAWDPNLLKIAHDPRGSDTTSAVEKPQGAVSAEPVRQVPTAAAVRIPPHAQPKLGQGVKVRKASGAGAYTIKELYARRDKIDGKRIVVRGKVVKVNPRILKQCWVHIQDGSGTPGKPDSNLVTTTPSTNKLLPAVGNIVTVSGTLRKDRDFGSGYRYTLILENSTYRIEGTP